MSVLYNLYHKREENYKQTKNLSFFSKGEFILSLKILKLLLNLLAVIAWPDNFSGTVKINEMSSVTKDLIPGFE